MAQGSARTTAAAEPDPLAAFTESLAAAEASLQKGELEAAGRRYGDALFEGWMALATLQRLDGRPDAARAAFQEAAAVAPQDRGALLALAGAALQLQEPARAIDVLDRLAARDAQDVDARRLLAKALAAGGQMERALRTLDEASAAAARDPEAAYLVATEYLWLKKPEPAERLFAQVLAARPLAQTHVLIGRTLRDAGEYDRARAHLLAALEQDPGARRAHYYLGMVLLADARGGPERIERAIAEFRAELKLDPHDALANDQLGAALLDAGRAEEALAPLEEAVRADARSAYLRHLGRCQLALGRPADAAASLRRALTAAGEEGVPEADLDKVHYQLGLALRKLGQSQEAAAHLAEAGRIAAAQANVPVAAPVPQADASPMAGVPVARRRALEDRVKTGLARAYMNLGILRAQARDFAAATELLDKAAAQQPDLPRLQYTLGVAAFNAGQFEKAASALTRALAAGENAEASAALGLAYLELGRLQEAETALRAALAARPDDASIRDNLARVLERIQRRPPERP